MTLTLYKTTHCVRCGVVRRQFDANGLEYDEINVEEDPEALAEIKAAGYTEAPVIRWRGRFHTIADLRAVIDSAVAARDAA